MFSIYTALVVVAALALCPFWRRERHFAPLYLWAVYCGLGPASVFGVSPLRFRWVLGCAFGAMGLLWLWRARRRTVDSMVVLPGLLIAWAMASAVYSELPDYSLLRAIALVPMYFGAFLGVRCLLHEQGGVERVGQCIITMISIQVALVIGSYMLDPDATYGPRFQGINKATGTAHILAYALPFAIMHAGRTEGAKRLSLHSLTLFMLFLLALTRSRTGILAGTLLTPIAYFALVKQLNGPRLYWALTGTFLLAALLWVGFANDDTLHYLRITSTDEILRTRSGRWNEILNEVWRNPWIGHGYGTVRYFNVQQAMTWTIASGRIGQTHTHNEYISLMYDIGIFPALIFAYFMAVIGHRSLAYLPNISNPRQTLLFACALCWATDAINSFSHDGLLTLGNPAATWFWIKSLLLFYGMQYSDGSTTTLHPKSPSPIT